MQVRNRPAQLGVFLRPQPDRALRVGTLIRESDGRVQFTVASSYIGLGPTRPIASLAWWSADEARAVQRMLSTQDKWGASGLLPPFFENLLPEGALRDLVEETFVSGGAFDNFDVLAFLGEGLPGAVVVRLESGEVARPKETLAESAPPTTHAPPIRFSLAGVQLKFAVVQEAHKLTLPFRGETGEIILKTPSSRYPFLPEAELTALRMAAAAGVRTAQAWLVPRESIAGVPERFLQEGPHCLAVQRFDRAPGGGRVHIEDLAQVYGAIHDAKYTTGNEATVMNTASRFSADHFGEGLEALRRVVVNLLLGNGDAHLKNWSFIFPDDRPISLSPAYDVVPTILWGDDRMALELGHTRNPYIIGFDRILRATEPMAFSERAVRHTLRRIVEAAFDTWPAILRDSGLPAEMQSRILDHMARLPFVQDVAPKRIASFRAALTPGATS